MQGRGEAGLLSETRRSEIMLSPRSSDAEPKHCRRPTASSLKRFNHSPEENDLTTGDVDSLSPAAVRRSGRVAPARPAVHPLLNVALVRLRVALLTHELWRVHARAVARHHVTTT